MRQLLNQIRQKLQNLFSQEKSDTRWEADGKDPFKRWARCVFCLMTRDYDYAYADRDWVAKYPAKSWDLKTKEDLDSILEDLHSEESTSWDLVRFVGISRMAVALGIINNEESWKQIRPVCKQLQLQYSSWEDLLTEYLEGLRGWLDIDPNGTEDQKEPLMKEKREIIAFLRAKMWNQVPFHQMIA